MTPIVLILNLAPVVPPIPEVSNWSGGGGGFLESDIESFLYLDYEVSGQKESDMAWELGEDKYSPNTNVSLKTFAIRAFNESKTDNAKDEYRRIVQIIDKENYYKTAIKYSAIGISGWLLLKLLL